MYKKRQSIIYFSRKLRFSNDCSNIFHISYIPVLASAICFTTIWWGGSIRANDTKKLDKLIMKAGSVLRNAQELLKLIVQRRMLHKLLNIMDIAAHSNQTTNCYRGSCLPTEITLHNYLFWLMSNNCYWLFLQQNNLPLGLTKCYSIQLSAICFSVKYIKAFRKVWKS